MSMKLSQVNNVKTFFSLSFGSYAYYKIARDHNFIVKLLLKCKKDEDPV